MIKKYLDRATFLSLIDKVRSEHMDFKLKHEKKRLTNHKVWGVIGWCWSVHISVPAMDRVPFQMRQLQATMQSQFPTTDKKNNKKMRARTRNFITLREFSRLFLLWRLESNLASLAELHCGQTNRGSPQTENGHLVNWANWGSKVLNTLIWLL